MFAGVRICDLRERHADLLGVIVRLSTCLEFHRAIRRRYLRARPQVRHDSRLRRMTGRGLAGRQLTPDCWATAWAHDPPAQPWPEDPCEVSFSAASVPECRLLRQNTMFRTMLFRNTQNRRITSNLFACKNLFARGMLIMI